MIFILLILSLLFSFTLHAQDRVLTDTPSIVWDFSTEGQAKASVVESVAGFFDAYNIRKSSDCTAATDSTINSGPIVGTFTCSDLNTAIFYGSTWLPVAITTATLQLVVNHGTSESITFAGDFSAQCRAAGTTVNSTWSTGVGADITITTANQNAMSTAVALTPNGTCSAGAMLSWRYVIDAANFSTNAANTRIIGVGFLGE